MPLLPIGTLLSTWPHICMSMIRAISLWCCQNVWRAMALLRSYVVVQIKNKELEFAGLRGKGLVKNVNDGEEWHLLVLLFLQHLHELHDLRQ